MSEMGTTPPDSPTSRPRSFPYAGLSTAGHIEYRPQSGWLPRAHPAGDGADSLESKLGRLAMQKNFRGEACKDAFKSLATESRGSMSGSDMRGGPSPSEDVSRPRKAGQACLSLQAHALLIEQANTALSADETGECRPTSMGRAESLPKLSAEMASRLPIQERTSEPINRAGRALDRVSGAILLDVARSPERAERDTESLHADDIAAPDSTVERRQADLADTLLRSEARQELIDLAAIPFKHEEHALMALADFMRQVGLKHAMSGVEFQGGVQRRADGYHVSTKIVIGAHHSVSPARGHYHYHRDAPSQRNYKVSLLHTHPIAPEFGSVSDGAGLSALDLASLGRMKWGQSLSPLDHNTIYEYTMASIDLLTGMVTIQTRPQAPVSVIGSLSTSITNDVMAGEVRTNSKAALSDEAKRMQRFEGRPQELGGASSYDRSIYKLYYGNLDLSDDMHAANARYDRIGDDRAK